MSGEVVGESTQVPIAGGQDVEIAAGDPYPAPYRGSRYSIVTSKQHHQEVLQWQYNDLRVMVDPPRNLIERMREFGKSDSTGKGSIRITAAGEILTKIHSSNYSNAQQAPVSDGWIPVYLGRLEGDLSLDVNINPPVPTGEIDVWSGFPFNHGERWSVSYDDTLIWTWRDFRFESAFDHSELIETYQQYRETAGRLYVNEFGHVFVNAPRAEVPASAEDEVAQAYADWERRVEREDDRGAQTLVSRRLKVTGDGDPEEGHLPLYVGHLSDFDGGLVPRAVVSDESYFVKAARGEDLSEYNS